jgi:hypothetical protein
VSVDVEDHGGGSGGLPPGHAKGWEWLAGNFLMVSLMGMPWVA